MKPGEESRQFQAMLEARRRLRDQTEGMVSFDDMREAADNDVAEFEEYLKYVLREHEVTKFAKALDAEL